MSGAHQHMSMKLAIEARSKKPLMRCAADNSLNFSSAEERQFAGADSVA
jgi:hypothetical protein